MSWGRSRASRNTGRVGLLARRRAHDAEAWARWGQLTSRWRTGGYPGSQPAFGRVVRVYQHARSGTKALMDFGAHGRRDTWWPLGLGRPRSGMWLALRGHMWVPPGTHSGKPVLWIDQVLGVYPPDLAKRAQRHERRLARRHGPGSARRPG
jgi:hypothetical protein